jgi:hypothetical protein
MLHQHKTANDLNMFLGANIRPRDPKEDKYHLKAFMPTAQADLTKLVSLSNFNGKDCRWKIGDQQQVGSCASWSTVEAEIASLLAVGGVPIDTHPGWLYEKVRMKEGGWPNDSGSFTADNCDIAISPGVPKLSLYPYENNAAFAYPQSMDADAPNQVYVASHHPFYPTDGNFLENIWMSLSQGMSVIISMYWTNAFFSPVNGILPEGQTQAQAVGGHAISSWSMIPTLRGLACQNHWTPRWNVEAANLGYDLRPGDFILPWSYLLDHTTNSMVFEARAVSAVSLAPQPTPDTDCKSKALNAVASPYANLQQQAKNAPLSRTWKYRLQGAKTVYDALQNVQ